MTEQVVGNWILESRIASGGMGTVYRARHKTLGTPAAVKVLQTHLIDAVEMQQRFRREAGIQALLEHPNIARVLDYHEQSGRWYLVMEFLGHGCLTDRIREEQGPMPLSLALAWVRQALSGLAYAHKKGIVHRDIKPDNLLLDAQGQVKIADFGIARDLSLTRMTQPGMALGTLHYMSPEQLERPGEVDERSDIYAMGIVLYELLGGRPPFEGNSFLAISRAKLEQDPPPLSSVNPAVSPALDGILAKAIAREPNDRFASCSAFLASLEALETAPDAGPLPAPTVISSIEPLGSTQFHTVPPSDSQPHTAATPGGSRSWALPAAALTAMVVAAVLLFGIPDSVNHETDQDALGRVLQEAHKAKRAADAAEEAAKEVRSVAEQAETAAKEALANPGLPPEKLAQAKMLAQQAHEGSTKVREAADRSEEARQTAEQAAKDGGVDLSEPPSEEPRLPNILPRSDEAAQKAARDAVEVARRGSTRAKDATSRAETAIERADKLVTRAESKVAETHRQPAGLPPSWPPEDSPSLPRDPQAPPGFSGHPESTDSTTLTELARQPEGVTESPLDRPPSGVLPPDLQRAPLGSPGEVFPRERLPEQPTVAVLAHGDPVMAGSFEQELERRLTRAQLDVQDEHNSLEVSRKLRSSQPPEAQDLAQDLLKSGFHVLVMIRVEEAERRHLEFRRQRGNAVGARLRINAYNLTTRTPIGRGWTEIIEYTELSAQAKAKRALLKESSELASSIRTSWKKARQA